MCHDKMSENVTSSEATPSSVDGRVVQRVRRQRVQLSCGECRAKKVSSAFVHFLRLLMCVLSSYHATAIGLARDVSRPEGHICAFMTRRMVNRRRRTSSLSVSDKLRLQTMMKFPVCVPKLNSFGACLVSKPAGSPLRQHLRRRCPRLKAQSNNSKMRFPLGEFINHRITRRIEPHAYTMLSIACSNSLSRYIPACGSLCHTFPA